MTSHARYLLGALAPSSALHGDDFTRSVSSGRTGTPFRPIHGDYFKNLYYRHACGHLSGFQPIRVPPRPMASLEARDTSPLNTNNGS
jgi:hypothetical protein